MRSLCATHENVSADGAIPRQGGELAAFASVRLLNKDEERQLFLVMNFWKCEAEQFRQALDTAHCSRQDVAHLEQLLREAREVRNRIVMANTPLVISVAKGYASIDTPLADLISDGNISLLRAVEKFDCTRGYRFSTYATWALRFNFNRTLSVQRRPPEALRHRQRHVSGFHGRTA